MFIIDLNYVAPLEELDQHMFDHVQYLKKYYEENLFLASGRKVPRTGGVILCLAESEQEVNRIIAEDPFYKFKLAEFKVTEFLASQSHPDLAALLGKNVAS